MLLLEEVTLLIQDLKLDREILVWIPCGKIMTCS
jgi:hypothetical protein